MAKRQEVDAAVPPGINGESNRVPADEEGKAKYPTLSWCLAPVWKDGKCVRASGDVRIKVVGGYFLVTVHCPSEARETTLTTDTLAGLWERLEQHLTSAATIWFPDWQSTKKARQDAKKTV